MVVFGESPPNVFGASNGKGRESRGNEGGFADADEAREISVFDKLVRLEGDVGSRKYRNRFQKEREKKREMKRASQCSAEHPVDKRARLDAMWAVSGNQSECSERAVSGKIINRQRGGSRGNRN